MNVTTTQMDPRVAAIHYKDYRKKVRQHRAERIEAVRKEILAAGRDLRGARYKKSMLEQEDELLMLSYREMAKGARILNLQTVLKDAGIDKNDKSRLPLLAVAQADWPCVWFKYDSNQEQHAFTKDHWGSWDYNRRCFTDGGIGFPRHTFPAEVTNSEWRKANNIVPAHDQKALVPAIPVMLRPAGDLSAYHILWEAQWKHEAPVDPLLLKHVSGFIYTVLAQWDLTPLEKMVLEGRTAS